MPPDKSISHRAVIFGSLAKGKTEIHNFLLGADCISTIRCFQALAIPIIQTKDCITVDGKGLTGLTAPSTTLDVGNSGTTARLLSGVLSGQSFTSELIGDASLQSRPMKRIMTPLAQMNASITSTKQECYLPFRIKGKPLRGISYTSPIASAQVKSAILLAGLYADRPTSVTEPVLSRNHTELMLPSFGASLHTDETCTTIEPFPHLEGQKVIVPGDISSAAFFLAAGLLTPNSEILLKNVGINPTRNGILTVAKAMKGDITLYNERIQNGELVADVLIRTSDLQATIIEGDIIPSLIDELPIIAIMAAFASGTTIIRDAAELRVKESDRIQVMVDNLSLMGCHIEATDDGMIIEGGHPLTGCLIDSKKDHRIAMSFAIAGMNSDGLTQIKDFDCVAISYPSFQEDLELLCR